MERVILNIISILVILMSIVLDSCVERTEDLISDGNVVRLRFACTPSPSLSRADKWNDSYDGSDADDFENIISTIDIILYDRSGNAPVRLPWTRDKKDNNVFIVTMDSSNPCITTDVSGNKALDGRIVIVANSSAGSSPFGSILFRNDVVKLWGIPMWGTKQLDMVPIDLNGVTHLGEVMLLRAMSKISVRLSDTVDEGYNLSSVSLNSYADYGNAVPNGASTVVETGELGIKECFNPVSSVVGKPFAFTPVSDRECVGYLTEVEAPDHNGMRMDVEISMSGNKVPLSNSSIRFVEYSAGSPTDRTYNLVRNHCYEFLINSVSDDEIQFTVCGLDNVSTDITFD